ncbi:RnfABCDGE type electron transport complex subunit D [Ructibacterium gallinarum]|uniref:Ion-translocating oxidoreductase complex subunit D n=1 Tax=Ructibacterium gallinarum TaxID=2779355 RepID=A0A9D5M5T5_9FIRM|nr:RnfABCDGE type electron transport complex subunit D [Ructibacterium gallinarum]MBE5040007.1 RnfABCDGE type electron transport complex subunit D [Ructibacterium gallinarum]
MGEKLIVSHAPHIAGKDSIQRIMLNVVIALLPALIAGCIVFGYRALIVTLICVASCVIFEALWQKLLNKPATISDFSAVVTGMLLAFNLPASIPLWIPVIGSFFAIIVVKQFFGGLGHNFMNPALGARAFLLASWALAMTTWPQPGTSIPLFYTADVVTAATPLVTDNPPSYLQLFLGNVGGCIGETSTLAILIGAAYLLFQGVIRLRVPVAFIATVALGAWIFGGENGFFTGDWLYQILSGGLMLGAFFMATDYSTTPFTPKGQIIFGIGCGIITILIRFWGGYPEGVSYSILLMNVATPLIDKLTAPRRYGTSKLKKEAA